MRTSGGDPSVTPKDLLNAPMTSRTLSDNFLRLNQMGMEQQDARHTSN